MVARFVPSHQFLGQCVELINKEFPHVHVVKGKARKPTTQGSVEVSHKAIHKWNVFKGRVKTSRTCQC
jgi:hypothetical protein